MSRSVNKAVLVGNLGADPEVRTTANGGKVATLSLATSRQWKDKAGEKQERTEWHRVVAWNLGARGTLADFVEKYCHKGDKVYVEGSIEYRSWQDREGNTRYTTEINAKELVLLGSVTPKEVPEDDAPGEEDPEWTKPAPAPKGKAVPATRKKK